jgi:hypothetical protein
MRVLTVEALREVELVGDEEDLDLCLQEGADDLASDLGLLALVRGGEGLVEEHEAVQAQTSGSGLTLTDQF